MGGVAAARSGPTSELRSCTIITTAANEKMAAIHDRMPVILPPSAGTPGSIPRTTTSTLGKLLVPAPPSSSTLHPVSTEVNNVRNKGPHLIDPVDPAVAGADDAGTLTLDGIGP